MFHKLLSNIAYHPSALNQFAFYSKRLKQEKSIRRLGLVFIILSMFVQIVAAMVPAEKSLAYSDNHIINGLKTKNDILREWDRRGSDIPAIYTKFGVTRQDIANLPMQPNATIKSTSNNNYWTIGRNSLSGYSNIQQTYKSQEVSLRTGGPTVYMRPLHAWDTNTNYTSYKAFKGRNSSTGKTFWILVDCGNYTQVGKTIKEEPPKKPELIGRKTVQSTSTRLKAGDSFKYKIEYRNRIPDSLAENVRIEDQLNTEYLDVVSPSNLKVGAGGKLNYEVGNLKHTTTNKSLTITVKLKKNVKNGAKICNTARIVSSNGGSITVGGTPTCIEVVSYCPGSSTIIDDGSGCNASATCVLTQSIKDRTKRNAKLTTKTSVTDRNVIKVVGYDYDFGDGTKQSFPSAALTDTRDHTYPVGSYNSTVAVNYTVASNNKTVKRTVCTDAIEFAEAPIRTTPTPEPEEPEEEKEQTPPSLSKSVKNVTKNLEGSAAANTVVSAGNVIEYQLTTSNSQLYDIENYTVKDYIGDVLDYADIDQSYLATQGGTYDASKKEVIWEKQTIAAKSELTKTFRVTVKSPIPGTNSPSQTSTNFDCKISNEYGDELTLDMECPVLKTVESLPNTGPGTTIAATFAITVVSGYFFARARLLAKESGIIRRLYQTGQGI